MNYLQRLGRHPGVPMAAALTLIGAVMGDFEGAAIMSLFWIPVLLTALEGAP